MAKDKEKTKEKKSKYVDYDWRAQDKKIKEKINKKVKEEKKEETTPDVTPSQAKKLLSQYKKKMSNRPNKTTSAKRKRFWSRFAGIEKI